MSDPAWNKSKSERLRWVLSRLGFESDDIRTIAVAASMDFRGKPLFIDHPLDSRMVDVLQAMGFKAKTADLEKDWKSRAHLSVSGPIDPEVGASFFKKNAPLPNLPSPVLTEKEPVAKSSSPRKRKVPKPAAPEPPISGTTVDFGMNWIPRPPQDPAPFMPALDAERVSVPVAERVSVPVAEAAAKVARKSRAERGLASMLAASGLEGEGTMLQRGMAKLLQKLGAEGTVVAGRRAGMLGKAAQASLGAAIKHPVMSGLNALTMIPLALSAGKGIVNGLSRTVTGEDAIGNASFDTVQRLEEEARRADLRRQMVQENRARVLAQNTMSLMQNAPDVAAQILAGRRLPRGGVVIGGTPRVDLMQEMAGQMADGSFRKPDPLAELTGG